MSGHKFDNWKSKVEELRLQMHLGSADARDEFEEQKRKLKKWADEKGKKIDELEGEAKIKLKKLRADLEELQVQAALGRAEAKDAFADQQKQLTTKLHEIEEELKVAYNSTEKGVVKISEEVEEELTDFKTKFELFRVQFSLGKAEAKDYWDDKKKDLSKRLTELDRKIDDMKDRAEDKWDDFSGEMTEAWKHIRKAFK